MDLIGYVRVSVAKQLDGYGLDTQETELRQFSERNGIRLVGVVREEAVSGTLPPEQRPGLMELLGRLDADEAEGMLAPNLDRVARELTVQEAVLAMIWERGKHVYTADFGEQLEDDPEDPMRTAIRQMRGVFSQLERGLIRKRMRAGLRHKADLGGFIGGQIPYGKKSDGNADLTDDPEEAAVLAQIRQWRHTEGRTLQWICDRLEESGTRTKRGLAHWQPKTVQKMAGPTRTREQGR